MSVQILITGTCIYVRAQTLFVAMISHNKIRTNLIDFHFVIRSMTLDTLHSDMRSYLWLLLRQNSSHQQKKSQKRKNLN